MNQRQVMSYCRVETYDLESASASVLQHRQNTHRRRTHTFILKRNTRLSEQPETHTLI